MAASNIKGGEGVVTKIAGRNVHGLNNLIKCNKVFSHLSKLKAEIAFLQETHLLIGDQSRLCRGHFIRVSFRFEL